MNNNDRTANLFDWHLEKQSLFKEAFIQYRQKAVQTFLILRSHVQKTANF